MAHSEGHAGCCENQDYKGREERGRAPNSDQFVCLIVLPNSGSVSGLNPLVKD